jgi:hypothetical protein
MRTTICAFAAALAFAAGAAAAGNYEKLLKGDYAIVGEGTCLVSQSGFDADQTPHDFPASFPHVSSFTTHGIRTFNGDGTGRAMLKVTSISHPFAIPQNPPAAHIFNRGAVRTLDLESEFTYTVNADLEVMLRTVSVNGLITSGLRAGVGVSFHNFPDVRGYLAQNLQSLTLAVEQPTVERHAYTDGDEDFRMCHRSRVLHERRG